ncbi:MAG: MaoC family dehydratase N-terminal domain-containing protein [Dehalococcoidia bacterium]|nr:MaoC family dehydratase [Chloroflexi bacterium CFX7]MCK6565917.1 MaoC family dehydratase N-terminal domain-containing protein [Dehalococcoidia bacterium]NUQ56380.1 MaoC family dehydratase N-terminal domain-containing protein [Dehalococcoidia bacterium]
MTEATTAPLITDEMRAQIGKESEPWTLEVDKTAIRMFARSVGHTDPVYYDEAAAKAAGYRSLPCPPGYLGTPVFDPRHSDPTFGGRRGSGGPGPQPSRPLKRVLNGGTEIEMLEDICAGDVLTATSHLAALEERAGSLGEMLISTNKTVYKNQHGRVVAVVTGTGIRY